MNPGELLSNLSVPHSLGDVGPDTVVLFSYTDPRVRDLIWELKYRRNEKIAESVSQVLFDVIKTELAERALFENFTSPLLIPMPMSAERRRERGWNQTEILGEKVYKLQKLNKEDLFTYTPYCLIKLKHTESQTLTENKKKRIENLVNTMEAGDGASGRNIILLDDVTTTGATFREAKRALKAAGARRILSLALAH